MKPPERPRNLRVGGHHSDYPYTYEPLSPKSERLFRRLLGIHKPVSTGRLLKYRLVGAVIAVILGIIYLVIQGWWNNLVVRHPDMTITETTVVTPNPNPTPTITAPNVLLAPYDRNAAEVISEMLAIARLPRKCPPASASTK